MASTFTTGFGIEKIGSGEQSGAWGTTTNHNLDILDRIASYKAVALSGTTHTLTVREASPGSGTENLQDGMYRVIKFTGALGANNTVTIAPNTAPAYFIFENATTDSASSGPYSVILTQGSGANITIQNGKNAIVYCDGAGSGAAVVNALSDLQIATLEVTGAAAIDGALTGSSTIQGTTITATTAFVPDASDGAALGTTALEFSDLYLADGAVAAFGDDQDVTLTHVADTGLLLNSTRQLQFGDSGTYIHQSADGVLDLVSDTEIEINATTIDINGAVALDGAITGATNITLSGELDAATLDISGNADIDGTTNLDAVDIDGAVQIDATLSVGVDDTGYDVKFFGATSGSHMLWDESADDLKLVGAAGLTVAGGITVTSGTTSVGTGGVTIDATAAADANPELELTAVARQFNVGVGGATFATTAIRGSYYIYDATATAYRFSINSSGNVGIGTDSQTDNLQVTGSGRRAIGISSTSGGAAVLEMFSSAAQAISYGNDLRFASISGLGDAGFSEKMRILAAGNLCVGVSGVRNSGMISLDYTSAGQSGMGINDTNSGNGGVHIGFLTGGTFRGSITNNNNTAVAYNTTSDARLKENLVPISDAIGRVNNLNPVKFNWIENGSVSEGFIAQEILAGDDQLATDMVTGDPDGDAETAPMQVDYAKITPLLTAALQQALAKIEALEARITALEG